MSNYHYGPYSPLTPRLQAFSQPTEKNGFQPPSQQVKPQQRSETRSPDAPKKSPSKNIKKSPKGHSENQPNVATITTKTTKKTSKSTKRKGKKSNSPSKDFAGPTGEPKKKLSGPKQEIMMNNYDHEAFLKQKPNSVRSISIPQDIFNQQLHDGDFANWLHERTKSAKNAYLNGLAAQHKKQNSDLIGLQYDEEKGQNEMSNDVPNVWPESKKTQKSENQSQSQRQSLEYTTTSLKKTLQNQVPIFASQGATSQKRNKVTPQENEENIKSIAKQKQSTPKGVIGSKEKGGTTKKMDLKLSPRDLDQFVAPPGPLSAQHQNYQNFLQTMTPQGTQSSKNAQTFDSQKDSRSQFRASLDPSQINYLNDQLLNNLPRSVKNESRPKGDFFKDIAAPSKKEASSARLKELPYREEEIPKKVKSAKQQSEQEFYSELNNYMHQIINGKAKRSSESQVEAELALRGDEEVRALSTRSEHHDVQEGEGKPYSNAHVNNFMGNDVGTTKEIVSDLLKRSNAKDIQLNPNAKFLLLRKQIQEKRGKMSFKSADWSQPGSSTHNQIFGGDRSPPDNEADDKGKLTGKSSPQAQLDHILNRTQHVLATFRNKQNTWEKEKKLLVAEVKHLRSVIEKFQ